MWRNWNPCALLLGMLQPLWKTVWQFQKKLKIGLPYDSLIPFMSIYPQELKAGSQWDICMPMFIAALFKRAKRWKQPKCLQTDKRINKMWHKHRMEYHSALKKKKILTYATIWMNLDGIILSERSQSWKGKCCMLHLYEISEIVIFIETEGRMVVTRGWGQEKRGVV